MFNFGGGGGGFPFGFEEHGGGGMGGGRSRKPVDTESYYKTLNVDKDASSGQIKKAYKELAKQCHPDKPTGNAELFKELQEAYDVLSKDDKRKLYDEGGKEAVESGGARGGGGGVDLFDILSGRAGRGGGGRRGKPKGEDVSFHLKVTLENLYNGMTKKLRLTKNIICLACAGQGTKSGRTLNCSDCTGTGYRTVIRHIGPGMIQQQQMSCPTCEGAGSVIPETDKCRTCKAKKTTKEKKTLEVYVDKGMKHGQKVQFKGEADQSPDTEPGDVLVILDMQDHPVFGREGLNLFIKKKISLVEALTGTAFVVNHLDGRKIKIDTRKTGEIIKPGQVKSIENEGMPRQGQIFEKGHLFIEFTVEFPGDGIISKNNQKKLRTILPPALHDVADVDSVQDDDMEDVNMTDVSVDEIRERQRAYRQANAYEEDDEDDEHHGHPGASCRQQ